MRERPHCGRLVFVCRVLACRMRCKGTLGQVRCVDRGHCGPCGIRRVLRPWCAVSCLCRISSRTKLRGGEGRDKGRFVGSGGWVDLCSRNLLTFAGWAWVVGSSGPAHGGGRRAWSFLIIREGYPILSTYWRPSFCETPLQSCAGMLTVHTLGHDGPGVCLMWYTWALGFVCSDVLFSCPCATSLFVLGPPSVVGPRDRLPGFVVVGGGSAVGGLRGAVVVSWLLLSSLFCSLISAYSTWIGHLSIVWALGRVEPWYATYFSQFSMLRGCEFGLWDTWHVRLLGQFSMLLCPFRVRELGPDAQLRQFSMLQFLGYRERGHYWAFGLGSCAGTLGVALYGLGLSDKDVQIHCGPNAGFQGAGVPPDASPRADGGKILFIACDMESPVDRAWHGMDLGSAVGFVIPVDRAWRCMNLG